MAKTRKNRGTRGVSRRRRGGQTNVYGSTTAAVGTVGNTASNFFSNIGSGLSNAWNSTKKAVSGVTSSNAAPAMGGRRRKRRGGQMFPMNKSGGSRRKRRGGQPVGFDELWNVQGHAMGGSRKRKRKY